MNSINRRDFIKSSSSVVAAAGIGMTLAGCQTNVQTDSSKSKEKPNIVFIITDDQKWDAMSFMNHPFVKTPNLDRMRSEGVHFSNAFVTTSLCSPSRASFLTGTYAHRHGVVLNGTVDYDYEKTPPFLQTLRDEGGYKTAFIGKWHMESASADPRPGYDYWLSFKGQGVYFNPALNENGREFKEEGYITDILTDYTCKWLDEHANAGPFCAYVSHKAVHAPFEPAKRHEGQYAEQILPEPASYNDDKANLPDFYRTKWPANRRYLSTQEFEVAPKREPREWKMKNKWYGYLEAINAVDEGVGKILDKLDELGQLDNTIIIFTSDNGYFMGEHSWGDKRLAYDEALRVPMLMRFPKLAQPGRTVDQMVLNIDVGPTLLDAAGIAIPQVMQGESMLPLITDPGNPGRSSFLYEYFPDLTPVIPRITAVRTKHWKYINHPDVANGVTEELYDLQNDPLERFNLAGDPKYIDILEEMRAELQRLMDDTEYEYKKLAYDYRGRSDGLMLSLNAAALENGTVKDISGNGNHAKINNVKVVDSERGNAFVFNGEGYLSPSLSDSLEPARTPVIVEAWIKPSGQTGTIAAYGGANRGYSLFIEDGIPRFAFKHVSYEYVADSQQNCINKWTHVVGTLDNHNAKIYINGELAAAMPVMHVIIDKPRAGLSIGKDIESPVDSVIENKGFEGLIESINVYRGEITADQVKYLYENSK